MAGLRLPKRLDVSFGCPNIEDMVREGPILLCIELLHCFVVHTSTGETGRREVYFRVRAAGIYE